MKDLIIIVSTAGVTIVVAIFSLIMTIWRGDKNISKSNSKEHIDIKESINAKQEDIDKAGITFHKVDNIERDVKNSKEILITLSVLQNKQQAKEELAGNNFVVAMETLLKIHTEKTQEIIELKNVINEQNLQIEKLTEQLNNQKLKQR